MVTAGHRELKSKFRKQKTEYRFYMFCNLSYFRSLNIITKIEQIVSIFFYIFFSHLICLFKKKSEHGKLHTQ